MTRWVSRRGEYRDMVGIATRWVSSWGCGVAIATWQISRHSEYRGAIAGYRKTVGIMVPRSGVTTRYHDMLGIVTCQHPSAATSCRNVPVHQCPHFHGVVSSCCDVPGFTVPLLGNVTCLIVL